jgi:large subunit ribosomal protein L13
VATTTKVATTKPKTYQPTPSDITRAWWIVDADDLVLGRLAADVAAVIRGKHKPTFAPHMDTGDFVVIVNAAKVRLTGNKLQDKIWYHHSGYPGGLRETPFGKLMETRPDRVVERAIKGMLPHNRLGRAMGRKLKVYAGPTHPHEAQQPKPLAVGRRSN